MRAEKIQESNLVGETKPEAPDCQPRSGERTQPTAQAVGNLIKTRTSPNGAKEAQLIPNIPLVIFHIILLQECDELLLKRMLFMMLFLSRNIFRDHANIRLANAKRRVPGLPRKFARPLLAHPLRRIRLHDTRDFGRRMDRTDPQEHVNMIVSSIDDQRHSPHLAHNPSQIGEQIAPKLRLD
jgi:hypothetical protein